MRSYPTWAPEKLPVYARVMRERCERLLINITADEECRRDVLTYPRAIHKELFVGLTPDGFPEYAGTYRGTPDTTLAGRRCEGPSALVPGGKFEFLPPDLVESKMNELLDFVAHTIGNPPSALDEKLGNLAKAFWFFGCIHPFLNGNGHVQRALFAAMATEFEIPL